MIMLNKIKSIFFAKLSKILFLFSEIIITLFFFKNELKLLKFIIVSLVFPDFDIIMNNVLKNFFSFFLYF